MDQEVEEVSFLPGEVILNKKAVYEPTKGQRVRQIVCSKGWAITILLLMGTVMIAVAVIAAFARPASESFPVHCNNPGQDGFSSTDLSTQTEGEPQTYISTNGEAFPWRDLRLPKMLIPESYSIFLHANITESYFTGNVHMNLHVVQDTDFIVFHTRELNLSNINVFTAHGRNSSLLNFNTKVGVIKELEYSRNEQYYLQLGTVLRSSTFVQVQVDFRGSLAGLSNIRGFYKSSYTIRGQERYIASTHFEATAARQAFPCLDEPALKAKFTMSLVRDQQHSTLFNMPLKRTAPYHGDLVVDEYEETVRMSTYLVAYVICDFKNISAVTKDGVEVRVFASEDKINMGHMALKAAVTVLEYYSSFFGTPYPLPKQDLIAIPNFAAGAMENWGLITFRESGLLFDQNVSTASSRESIVITVAHELAHQWFGNLVTMKWWNDLWLNEGFATFVETNIGTDRVDKTFRKGDSAVAYYLDVMSQDSLMSSHPIAVTVSDPNEIESVFDKISYDKGSAIIRMLQHFMGEEPFRKGLSNYLQKHKYGNADTSDLWDSLQEVSSLPSHLTVSQIMDTWTKQMGLPVVTVIRRDGKIHLSQQHFLLMGSSGRTDTKKDQFQSPYGYKWIIPLTYKTSNQNAENLVWLSEEEDQAELSDASATWLKANVDTQGFYRVNYDKKGWQAIARQLSEDHTVFSVADRMGLIDDVFYLARAGLTDYGTALDLTKYLINETDYFVWSIALSQFTFLRSRLLLEEEYSLLKDYTLSLTKSLIDAADWSEQDNPVNEYMQNLMVGTAVVLDYQPVIDRAVEQYKQWKEGEEIKISNGLRYTVYSQGVKYGTSSDWNHVLEKYMQAIVPSERHILLSALSCSLDGRLLQMLLKYALDDSKVKSQDSHSVLASVAAKPSGQLFAWKFLREHYDTIYDRFGSSSFLLSEIIEGIVASFNTQFDYDEIVAFFKNKKIGSAKFSLHQSLEYVQSHIDWTKNYMPTVKTWIRENTKL
ncbi:hypothetical protein BsWGS_25444 [Bradybaena similaris]